MIGIIASTKEKTEVRRGRVQCSFLKAAKWQNEGHGGSIKIGFYSVRWEASRRILAKERYDLDYF